MAEMAETEKLKAEVKKLQSELERVKKSVVAKDAKIADLERQVHSLTSLVPVFSGPPLGAGQVHSLTSLFPTNVTIYNTDEEAIRPA